MLGGGESVGGGGGPVGGGGEGGGGGGMAARRTFKKVEVTWDKTRWGDKLSTVPCFIALKMPCAVRATFVLCATDTKTPTLMVRCHQP